MALRLFGAVLAVLALAVVQRTEAWDWYCKIQDVLGVWTLNRDIDTTDDYRDCYYTKANTLQHRISLMYPDLARDEYGNYGTWTLIYGVAAEITIHGRKYYSFFEWTGNWWIGWRIDCTRLEIGSSRDVLTNNYACFRGRKGYSQSSDANGTSTHAPTFFRDGEDKKTNPTNPATLFHGKPENATNPATLFRDAPADSTPVPTLLDSEPPTPTNAPRADMLNLHEKVRIEYDLVDRINSNDLKLWEAHVYDHLLDMTNEDMIMMAGGNMTLRGRPPKPAPMTDEQRVKANKYPRSFDWRNVNGVNYISPVRNQGYCGSCYAFAALGMYESRIRIMSKNSMQPFLSPQDIVDCSPYAYGCWGGWIFPEGMYAEEFGFLDETCNIYAARTQSCSRDATCTRYYGTNYQYVGGYFGASNEFVMMESIFNNGPIVVGFAVYYDFIFYRRGVYYHSGPDWLLGFHAVVVVGWGQDERSGTKYWIVKNSWSKNWGENGYFRIARGRNDCDFEAEAFEAFPMI